MVVISVSITVGDLKDGITGKLSDEINSIRKANTGATYKDQDEGKIAGLERAIELIKEEIG